MPQPPEISPHSPPAGDSAMSTPPQVVPAIFGKAGAPAADAASSAASGLMDGFTCGSAHGALIGQSSGAALPAVPARGGHRHGRPGASVTPCAGDLVRPVLPRLCGPASVPHLLEGPSCNIMDTVSLLGRGASSTRVLIGAILRNGFTCRPRSWRSSHGRSGASVAPCAGDLVRPA